MLMTYSIKKHFPLGVLLMIFILTFQNCQDDFLTHEEYFEICPYELQYGRRHSLTVPLTITPHQLEYKVGDTMTFSTIFSDSIYDLSRETSFKIENFPFLPVALLYRFDKQFNWDAGFEINEMIVDSVYQMYCNIGSKALTCFFQTQYIDDNYVFSFKTVLNEPGRYCLIMTDLYQERTGHDENVIANRIAFEGKCPETGLRVCTVLQGNPHYDEFKSEMIHLDKNVYRDNFQRLDDEENEIFGAGNQAFEWNGFFGFEVVE